jgi:hypothetical protein
MNYNDASIIITPNGFKAGKLYAVKGADLTVSRATSTTRVNANGVIESVGANVPRIDYSGGGCPSILVEPQRTNLVLNSATVTTQTINVTAVPHTISFYGSGTITLSGTHTATVVGLGTARKTYTFTPTAGNLILTVSGTCTNGQLEAGSYATSYIPTTTASVTRNADVISKTGISSLIGQTEGTIFIDANISTRSNTRFLLDIQDGTNNDTFQFVLVGNTLTVNIYDGGVSQAALNGGFCLGRKKIALGYKLNDFVLYVDGIQISTDTSGTIPTTSLIALGYLNIASGFELGDSINTTTLWKTRLTNAELAELTTI